MLGYGGSSVVRVNERTGSRSYTFIMISVFWAETLRVWELEAMDAEVDLRVRLGFLEVVDMVGNCNGGLVRYSYDGGVKS